MISVIVTLKRFGHIVTAPTTSTCHKPREQKRDKKKCLEEIESYLLSHNKSQL